MALITFSPSNLSQYRLCPYKFWAQKTGLIKWKDSPQKARGTAVHASLEQAVKGGIETVKDWPSGLDVAYVQDTVRTVRGLAETTTIYTEHEMAIDHSFKKSGWWDEETLLRAKADLLCVVPEQFALIGDWKTGKIYPDMDFQLRVESILVHALYKVKAISWMLFYVDQGQTKKGVVDFSNGLSEVQDILNLMKECRKASSQGGYFPQKKNQFCRWCEYYHTEHCTASESW